MANPNSDLILAGTGAGGAGGLELAWIAPTTATAPVNAHVLMPQVHATWEGMGYVSSDGVTLGNDESFEEINAYGMTSAVRKVNTKADKTIQVTFLETNEAVLEVYNRLELGTIVPNASGDFNYSEGAVPVQRYSLVIDIVDGTNHIRKYYPSVEVTDRGEQQVGNGTSINYQVTFTAYPDTLSKTVYTFNRIPELASS